MDIYDVLHEWLNKINIFIKKKVREKLPSKPEIRRKDSDGSDIKENNMIDIDDIGKDLNTKIIKTRNEEKNFEVTRICWHSSHFNTIQTANRNNTRLHLMMINLNYARIFRIKICCPCRTKNFDLQSSLYLRTKQRNGSFSFK